MKMEVVVASDAYREDLYVDIGYGNTHWAEASYDLHRQAFMLTIFAPPDGADGYKFPLSEVQNALELARQKLKSLGYTDKHNSDSNQEQKHMRAHRQERGQEQEKGIGPAGQAFSNVDKNKSNESDSEKMGHEGLTRSSSFPSPSPSSPTPPVQPYPTFAPGPESGMPAPDYYTNAEEFYRDVQRVISFLLQRANEVEPDDKDDYKAGKTMRMEVVVASDAYREDLYVDIGYGNTYWAEASYDPQRQAFMLTIFAPPDGADRYVFHLSAVQDALQRARRSLEGIGYIDRYSDRLLSDDNL